MFVGGELLLDVSFESARTGLASLARAGSLLNASADAYGEGAADLVRVGPGSAAGVSRLVRVHLGDLVVRGESAVLILRWEAVALGGELFPALDADVTLTPAAERAALLSLAGVYRPPLGWLGGALDRAVLNRVAAATIRVFLSRLAESIARCASDAESPLKAVDQDPPDGPSPCATP
jgi:hypothetical protein